MDTQKRMHPIMDEEIPAIVYTQKHLHSTMDKEIHTIMDSKIHRNTHAKRGTHTYMNLHIKSPHEKGFEVYTTIRDTQHIDPILSSIFAVPKPLWPQRHSRACSPLMLTLSSPGPSPLDKAVHISLSSSIFIFLLHKTLLTGQDRKCTFLFLEAQARAKRDEGDTRRHRRWRALGRAALPTRYRVGSRQHTMLQSHPINTSFPSQDIALQMSSKTI